MESGIVVEAVQACQVTRLPLNERAEQNERASVSQESVKFYMVYDREFMSRVTESQNTGKDYESEMAWKIGSDRASE